MSKIVIQQINDSSDKYFKKHDIFDLPMRLLLIGKSQLSGKTSLLINLIAQEWGYKSYFKPEDIYIISPSSKTEKLTKFVNYMDIPLGNIFDAYDEDEINVLYELLKQEHDKDEEKEHKLLIFDDCSYSGKLSSLANKSDNVMEKLFCNGRHQLISVIIIAQKYTQLSTCLREQATGIIMWESSNQQIEKLEEEHNSITDKKKFIIAFRNAVKDKHSFFTINYKYQPEHRYFKGLSEQIIFI